MISCSTIKFIGNPTTTTLITTKKEPLEYEKKFWHLMDPPDSVAGMSVDRAYKELINQKGEK